MTATTITPELLDQLLANYEKPEDLTGENGLFKQLKKALIERALGAELTEHGVRPRQPQRGTATRSKRLRHGDLGGGLGEYSKRSGPAEIATTAFHAPMEIRRALGSAAVGSANLIPDYGPLRPVDTASGST